MEFLKFKDYIQESVEIDPDKIVIDNPESYSFEFDGYNYLVKFERMEMISFPSEGIEISFKGPKGHMPTGLSGPRAYKLYGIMLSAVIAYIKKYKPKALYFSGATSAMDLIYKRFADRYAGEAPGKSPDEIFIRVNMSEWIRKDVYDKLDPYRKTLVKGAIDSWNDMEPGYVHERRKKSAKRRENYLKYKDYFGGFVSHHRRWYILTGVNDFGFDVLDERLQKEYIFYTDIPNVTLLLPHEINKLPEHTIHNFAQRLSSPTLPISVKQSLPSGCAERIIQATNKPTNEAVDIDPSKIELINPNYYDFMFDGSRYSVNFSTHRTIYIGKCVSIGFYGPRGTSPTGTSGSKASQVYGIMLSAVIAYIEKYKPEGLSFFGATDNMDLVYKKFADRYAKDEPGKPANKVFIRIDAENWIRKDVYENLHPSVKNAVTEKIQQWSQEEGDFVLGKKQAGVMRRRTYMKMRPYFGGFALDKYIDIYDNDKPYETWHMLCGVSAFGEVSTLTFSYDGRFTTDLLNMSNNTTIIGPNELNKVPIEILEKFAKALTKEDKFRRYLPEGSYERLIQVVNKNNPTSPT